MMHPLKNIKENFMVHCKKDCSGKNKKCSRHDKAGSLAKFSLCKKMPKKASSAHPEARVDFDEEQTPNMVDVKFKPFNARRPKITVVEAYPGTGSEKSLVSQDLVK